MRCPICSHSLEPGTTTCPECGTGILPPPAAGVEPTPFVRSQSAPRWPLVLSIIGIVAALVVIAVALLPLLGNDDDDDAVTTGGTGVSTTSVDDGTTVAATESTVTSESTVTNSSATSTGGPSTSPAPSTSTSDATSSTSGTSTSPSNTPTSTSNGAMSTTAATTSTSAGGTTTTTISFPSPLVVAQVEASCVASDSTDSRGNPITFNPLLTIDGNPATAWRCDGDAVHQALVYSLATPGDVTVVGAIPGWAGRDPFLGTDRFDQNRRVSAARWSCLDAGGREVGSAEQDFADRPTAQYLPVSGFVDCAKVVFEVLDSTSSGGRDFTALSEVEVLGPTAG